MSDSRATPSSPEEHGDSEAEVGSGTTLTPGAARRRFGSEMKAVREAVGLRLHEAAAAIQRDAATLSRIEGRKQKNLPRLLEVDALLNCYAGVGPDHVTQDVRDRIHFLLDEGAKDEWFEPFKSAAGQMLPNHLFKFVGYETDAIRIRNYESDLVPGLLQTSGYANEVAQAYFPATAAVQYDTFAEFRVARRENLLGRDDVTLSFVVNEVALRRAPGGQAVMREQLEFLSGAVSGEFATIEVRIIPLSVFLPAALNGPFVLHRLPKGVEDFEHLVYLESASGTSYLTAAGDVGRFDGHWKDLVGACLSREEALQLLASL